MHVKEILEAEIERLRIDMLIARQEMEIYRAAMNDPQLTEPGRKCWEEKCKAAKSETKVLMSPDRDQLILTINGAFSVIGCARGKWAESEEKSVMATIESTGNTPALRSRLDHFSPDNW